MSVLELTFGVMGARGRLILADRDPGDEPSERLRDAAAGAGIAGRSATPLDAL
jgi:hypothetical protein